MEKKRGIDSFTLHILTCVGRLAFPIFAFMIAEGCYYTSNVKKYMLRLFLFAIISEIPFNLIMGSSVFYPFHQNVLWTFLLGVLSIQIIEKAKKKQKKWISFFVVCLVLLMDFLLGTITMVDYNAAGILTVLLFYFFRKKTWISFAAQLVGLYYLNVVMLGNLYYPVTILGHHFEIAQQSWLYHGEQGYHSKWFKYFCYAFYPVHLLILVVIWQWRIR